MLDETQLLPILDMMAERAREFTHVADEILKGERALQARDAITPDEWQVISIISAYINYVAERNRCRYGHFAFDIDPKNTPQRKKDAHCTLNRMRLFWNEDEDDELGELTEEQCEARQELIANFLMNDKKIKEHMKQQPDVYAEDADRDDVRQWMMRLHVLGDVEKRLLEDWKRLIELQRDCKSEYQSDIE